MTSLFAPASLGFATPVLLAGLAGVVIPLLVHLLRRRRPRPTPFPGLVLLLGAQKRHARRRRLREVLLLLVRMALLAAVALTLAGPHCSLSVDVPESAGRDQSAVILVDDTLSMRYRPGGGGQTLFAVARQRARGLLDVLPATAPVGLLTLTDTGSQLRELSLDRERLRRTAVGLSPTWRAALATDALERAQVLLREGPAGKPRAIYLITDLTRSGFPSKVTLDPDVTLQVIDVGQRALPNLGVVDLRPWPSTGTGVADHRLFQVGVRNATARAVKQILVRLRAGGKELARGRLDVAPHTSGKITLKVPAKRLPADARFVEATIAPDGLGADDTRVVARELPTRVRVLLVDGDPRETRHDDEIFYLEAALRALGEGRLRISVQVVAGGDLQSAALDVQDVVILAHVATLRRRGVRALTKFVRRGGGLLITLGSRVNPDYYNQVLGSALLPGRLRSIRAGGISGAAGTHGRYTLAGASPALARAVADPATRKALLTSRVYRHGLVSPRGHGVLLRLLGGAPLLIERRLGRGRVLLWTTTIDRDWTDLPVRPAFLPMVRALVLRASGQSDIGLGQQVQVGQPVTLHPAAGDLGLVVRNPVGHLHRLHSAAGAAHSKGGAVIFNRTDIPGGYEVFSVGPAGEMVAQPGAAFAVVPPASESDLRRLAKVPDQRGKLTSATVGAQRSATIRRDITAYFALLCLILLLAESLLAARFGQWRRRLS
jgi:Aerotolerance regulator N-terminal